MEYTKIAFYCVCLLAVCQHVAAESSQKEFDICKSYDNTRALLAHITNPDFPAATVSTRQCQCRVRFADSMAVTSRLLIIAHQGESFPLHVLYKSVSEDDTYRWPGTEGVSLALDNDTDRVVIAENASYVELQLDTLAGASRLVFRIEIRADTEMLVTCRDNSSESFKDNSSVPTTTTPAQKDKETLEAIGEYCSPELVIILGSMVAALLLIILVVSITLCCVIPKKKKEYLVQMRRSMMVSPNVDIPKSVNNTNRAPTVLYDDAEVVNILKSSGNNLTVPAVGYTRTSGQHYANADSIAAQYDPYANQ